MDEDKIILKLIEHDEALRRIEEQILSDEEKERLFSTLEDLATNMKALREEQVFTIEWIKRVQSHMDSHERRLQQLETKMA